MKKIKDPIDLLKELGIVLEYDVGFFNGRNIRYLEHAGLIQIGDDNFDRWANSVDFEFDIWLAKGQRQFIRWVESKTI